MEYLGREKGDGPKMKNRTFCKNDFVVFAHRGAGGHEPENTLRAIGRALDFGAKWVEVDVYAVEGELVVIHDRRLERTTNGTGRVMGRSLAYLRSLDAGKGERIPFLREVCELIEGRAGINVELKGPATAALLAAYLASLCRRRSWFRDRLVVSSFDRGELKRFHELARNVPVGLLVDGPLFRWNVFAASSGAVSVHVNRRFIDAAFVRKAHSRGLKVFVFTVNRPAEAKGLRAIGVDGIFTDFPDRFCRRSS